MKSQFYRKILSTSSILSATAVALTVAIFVADTITELEIAVPVFYTVVVMMSVSLYQKRGVIFVAAGCIALTMLSDALTPTSPSGAGLINTMISLSAIVVTTYFVLKIKSVESTVFAARAQLAHIARVTTLGELTASIAHEVNQPLAATVINSNACLRWLESEPANLEEARKAVERIAKDANRASQVVNRFRELSKKRLLTNEWLQINDTILEIVALTASDVRHNHISMRTQLADNLLPVQGDKIHLQQVILNLILNAVDSLKGADEEPREILINSANDGTKAVLVTIRDSGGGPDPENFDRIFDAFYTTKPEGMGMGLAICRSIIEAHGGRIWVTSDRFKGAAFQFTLPTSRGLGS